MKLTFLGTSGFFARGDNFHSNILLQSEDGKNLLIDCGTDIARSLDRANKKVSDINAIYISHLHGDHSGGLEYVGFHKYFIKDDYILDNAVVPLFLHKSLEKPLWDNSLSASMSVVDKGRAQLHNYFNPRPVENGFMWKEFDFWLVPRMHCASNDASIASMVSYGLIIKSRKTQIYISSDCSSTAFDGHILLERAMSSDIIFHDCDVYNATDVHPHYKDLCKLPADIKRRMWLYHYSDLGDKMPNAIADGFLGFVQRGQEFNFDVKGLK